MKLRCIKSFQDEYGAELLTFGKIYELDKIGEDSLNEDAYVGSYYSFYLKGDDDIYRYFPQKNFIDLREERNNKLKQLLN